MTAQDLFQKTVIPRFNQDDKRPVAKRNLADVAPSDPCTSSAPVVKKMKVDVVPRTSSAPMINGSYKMKLPTKVEFTNKVAETPVPLKTKARPVSGGLSSGLQVRKRAPIKDFSAAHARNFKAQKSIVDVVSRVSVS